MSTPGEQVDGCIPNSIDESPNHAQVAPEHADPPCIEGQLDLQLVKLVDGGVRGSHEPTELVHR